MPRIAYVAKKFNPEHLAIIRRAIEICDEYNRAGFDLTLRQLYYQFVARGYLPNTDQSYKRLGSIINDARLAGLIDWDYIVDRTRFVRDLSHWNDPAHIIGAVARSFRHDVWADQPARVEVWIEKDALVGVIEDVCQRNDVPFFSCRGYTSQSEIWGAAQRLGQFIEAGQRVVVVHLGDHDPSGIDMSRDIEDRLQTFVTRDWINAHPDDVPWQGDDGRRTVSYAALFEAMRGFHGLDGSPLRINRIALNMDQVEEYDPPPNPAKLTDSRCRGYIEEHGQSSWELDALEPTVLAALIEEAIADERDPDIWAESMAKEARERELLERVSARWGEVEELVAEEEA